jgi:TPR repeat protein
LKTLRGHLMGGCQSFLAVAAASVYLIAASQPVAGQEISVLELVEECDILAAHPADPERMAEGVADDMIVPRLAILACEDVIERDPDDPRFVFQLGRALLAGGREAEAYAQFKEAAEKEYAAAWAYLGDAYQFGFGTQADGTSAYRAYQKAVELGFREAESLIDQLTFQADMYTMPFVGMFFENNYEALATESNSEAGRWRVRNYVFNLIQNLNQECEPFLSGATVALLYRYRFPTGWSTEADDSIAVAIQTSVAEHDAEAFLRRHGCEGLIARHVFTSMGRFLALQPN